MKIIKLDATGSTNLYLKGMLGSIPLDDYAVVIANEQTEGRGQMGTKWSSDPGKNLTFSVLKNNELKAGASLFLPNMGVSLAIYRALKQMLVPDLHIKWPNDILSGTHKICGILIENIFSGSQLRTSVIGVGLNVNQTTFNDLPNVSSLKLLLGKTLDLEQLLQLVLIEMKKVFVDLKKENTQEIKTAYEKVLFRKDKPSTFMIGGKQVMGFISGVSNEGKLKVTLEDAVEEEFDLKEIRLLY